jgi:GT2 family glycosyltransferase
MSDLIHSVPELSVLVVGYRSRRFLDGCLGGALQSKADVEILYVDCSDDGSTEWVRERYPTVRVFDYVGNLGFGRGNNLLARNARGRYLLLLNPDTIPTGLEIDALLAFAKSNPDAVAWGGRTVFPDGTVDFGSHQATISPVNAWLAAVGLSSWRCGTLAVGSTKSQSVDVISGAFFMTTTNEWRAVGGFDERFFMYAEEVDLCRRLAAGGRTLLVDPSICLIHDGQSGDPYSASRRVQIFRGNSTFARKHFGPVGAELVCVGMLLGEIRRLIQYSVVSRICPTHRSRSLRAQAGELVRRAKDWWPGWQIANDMRSVPASRQGRSAS